jgi:hypothetical protein
MSILADEGGVYEIRAEVSEIPATEDADEYAASFFWNLMNLPFHGSGAPDYGPVLRSVRAGGHTEFPGVLFDYGRRARTYDLVIAPRD